VTPGEMVGGVPNVPAICPVSNPSTALGKARNLSVIPLDCSPAQNGPGPGMVTCDRNGNFFLVFAAGDTVPLSTDDAAGAPARLFHRYRIHESVPPIDPVVAISPVRVTV